MLYNVLIKQENTTKTQGGIKMTCIKYIDIVLVRLENGDKRLFRAPAWSYLTDTVEVSTLTGPHKGLVLAKITLPDDEEDEKVKFILSCMNAHWPLSKVIGYVDMHRLNYNDEQTEQTEETETKE